LEGRTTNKRLISIGGRVGQAALERSNRFKRLFDDQAAFRAWYDQALPVVYGFTVGRCGGDASMASEITQEAFVDAVRERDRFDGVSDPVTWVCAIARNKAVDQFRRLERERRRHLRLVRETPEITQPSDGLETREVVLNALRTLPRSQQAALVMHYLDGLPMREIARNIGRSESAVESLLTRARESFRRSYKGDVDG
jgi:RNA polymerase sigma-70 factor (ECF subfamily)